jgi:hypothetical protein
MRVKRGKLFWFSSDGGNSKKLKFVSSTRCGFDFSQLDEIYNKLQMKIKNVPMSVEDWKCRL